MIKKILIANRGEIAVRVIRACRELGIISASIYSTPDIKMLHTKLADEAYLLEGFTSSETYLDGDKIIALAKNINADAIHPGYGFFSENPEFIEKVEKSGIIFIGPSSQSVRMMGSKTEARRLMQINNVPIVPGTVAPINDTLEGKKIANEIGYPVLLKASAGGGGKGMRKIFSDSEFDSSFEAVKREALKSFANDSVYLEKLVQNPKHIEVQIIGDKFGNYVHLYERDCSIQRRHQKIIEEAPASTIQQETREKITLAAINAAKSCNYYNAGTIEFLMDKNNSFYFLEMNTRLQVEHPVSEAITGIDLVKEQINVASGKKLSFRQEDISIKGHAIECRIYAEDSSNNFMPSTGIISKFEMPAGPGIRIDAGVYQGSEISFYYDPMIAKLICFADSRKHSINRAIRALSEFKIAGIISNIDFLSDILSKEKFLKGDFDINYLEDEYNSENSIERTEKNNNIAIIMSALIMDNKKNSPILHTDHTNYWISEKYA